jgi:hypothetical protein
MGHAPNQELKIRDVLECYKEGGGYDLVDDVVDTLNHDDYAVLETRNCSLVRHSVLAW